MTPDRTVFELRQYTLRPGRRDELIELFDREFVETQEAAGMRIVGQFRDLDRPDRFVWVRGFRDMTVRAEALAAFYGGPVWKEHGAAANATMIDSSDVLLLRAAAPGAGFPHPAPARPGPGDRPAPTRLTAAVHRVAPDAAEALALQVRAALGGRFAACLATEPAENTFPALPVRTGEHLLAWFATGDVDAPDRLAPGLVQALRLESTARSQLR
ncbi:NIPSNAP family protein [Glycomyces terrestris]|uniref:NIPSNAP family protein n=1 Tax=Glycomyces terrestris TaxID=2493553 RepID=A0A426V452_9ACTN|nr:NIPSNAP family protein [Glycomyces terrestris]RRS01600.1 NIPSNAP family protein [Glycomyces terrestris]